MQCSAYQLLSPFLSSEATTPTSHSISSSFPWERALRRVAGVGDARWAQAEEASGEKLDLSEHGPGLKPRLGVGCSNPPHSSGAWQCRPRGECSGADGTAQCRCTSSRSGARHSPSGAPPPWRWRRRRPGLSWQPPRRCQTFPYTRSTKVPRRMTGILSAPRVHFSFAPFSSFCLLLGTSLHLFGSLACVPITSKSCLDLPIFYSGEREEWRSRV